MQGVDAMGDFAIQVRLKMMTKPGEQFVIRRRAYAMIKKAFDGERHQVRVPDGAGRGRRADRGRGACVAKGGAEAGSLTTAQLQAPRVYIDRRGIVGGVIGTWTIQT